MGYEIDPTYKEVPQRIADLKAVHPDARLRPANPKEPFRIVTIDDKTFIVYTAACYRDADDPLPAMGCAWEPFPGTTPYTRNSELMNAETSAWGRAIIACLRSESKSIASAEEVRNRRAENAETPRAPQAPAQPSRRETHSTVRSAPRVSREPQETGEKATQPQIKAIFAITRGKGITAAPEWLSGMVGRDVDKIDNLSKREASDVIKALNEAEEDAAVSRVENAFEEEPAF